MARRIGQAHLLMLALHFHQQRADPPQQPDTHRMIVDESARPSVPGDDPAQHDLVIPGQTVLFQHRPDRVIVRRRETCGDAGLFRRGAHQPAFRSRPQRQAQTVEQNRFAGAGLAGEDRQSLIERQIQPLDQHDIADRQRGQHAAPLTPSARSINLLSEDGRLVSD